MFLVILNSYLCFVTTSELTCSHAMSFTVIHNISVVASGPTQTAPNIKQIKKIVNVGQRKRGWVNI